MGNTHHHHEDNSHLVKQAEERMQKERHEHEQRMKELANLDKERKRQQKEKNVIRIKNIINELNASVKADQSALKISTENKTLYGGKKEKLENDIFNFNDHKNETLKAYNIQIGLDKAEQDYKRDYNEIANAIETTGQHHDNVGKFLKLTLSLIGTTMDNQAETNKLDIALATFGKIMNDECQDKLTIDSYFNEANLERFIDILANEGYKTLDHLICDDDDIFEKDILCLLENGIKAELKENEETEEIKQDPIKELEGDELCIYLLKKWKLDQYWNKLRDDGWDDAEDWIEMTEDDLIEIIDKKGKRSKFMRECKKWKQGNDDKFPSLKQMEKTHLKRICRKPESWQNIQNEKIEITKQGLLELSPILSIFFGKMNDAVIQISQLLSYKQQLTEIQENAIKMRKENNNKLKAITMRKTDNDQRRKWVQDSQCQIYSDSFKQWFSGKIIEIKRDDEGEWLNIQYTINNDETRNKQIQRYSDGIKPLQLDLDDNKNGIMAIKNDNNNNNDDDSKEMDLQKQCGSLITASIVSVNVTDSMMNVFNKNQLTERGLTLAIGVEGACMNIIHGQGQIRQSVFLAKQILEYKPANMESEKTKTLWTAIDNGIIQILHSALEMVKVSAQYFAFFLRFRSSFQFFISCYDNGKDTKLMISLDRLRKDVRDFNAFTANFSKQIEALSKTSMDCIAECVKTQIGVKNWEDSRNSLELTEKRYLELKRLFDQKGIELDNEFDKIKQKQIDFQHKEAGAIYQVGMLNKRIKQNNDYLKQCQTALTQLQSVVI